MNCSKNKTSELHSVVFKTNPPNKWTTITARKWLDDNHLKRLKSVDKTKNSLRYRIIDPACFQSFTTKVVKGKLGTINLVIGWYAPRNPSSKKKTSNSSNSTAGRVRRGRIRKPSSKKKTSNSTAGRIRRGKVHFSSRHDLS